jgi:hypothetical protein
MERERRTLLLQGVRAASLDLGRALEHDAAGTPRSIAIMQTLTQQLTTGLTMLLAIERGLCGACAGAYAERTVVARGVELVQAENAENTDSPS